MVRPATGWIQMKQKPPFQVIVFANRARETVSVANYHTLAAAARAFDAAAGARVSDANDCVLLSVFSTPTSYLTLAAKSTDGHSVEYYPAYYQRKAGR
jgi:hypothetical protein